MIFKKKTHLSGNLAIILMIIFLIPIASISNIYAQSTFDTTAMGLQMPTITMSPSAGQPGTQVEIKVTNMPAVPKDIDPRIEFYVYLPFVSAIGSNVPNNCNGESCFALYSFEEIGQDKLAPKTITFTLFSTTNKKPVTEAGLRESICDLKVNGKTIQRYSETCDDLDQPVGDYEIKFGWGIERSNLFDIRETMTFTVLEKQFVPEVREQDKDEKVIQQFSTDQLVKLQEKTNGFMAFIPWNFEPNNTLMQEEGIVEHGAGGIQLLKMIAISRLVFDGLIPHIQSSWLTNGVGMAQLALQYGADDFGGTLIGEEVVSCTGARSTELTGKVIIDAIHQIGYDVEERDNFYKPVSKL